MIPRASAICIGNFAIDCVKSSVDHVETLGGAGLRFVSAWALFGMPIEAMAIVGNEPQWTDLLSLLERNRIQMRIPVRVLRSLRFTTQYDQEMNIVGFEVENPHLMPELATAAQLHDWQQLDLVHVCPFSYDDQAALVSHANRQCKLVSTMIHYSSLTEDTRLRYMGMIEAVDYLFLNHDEAQFLLNHEADWVTCGRQLSNRVRRGVFLTLGKYGATAFSKGELVAVVPSANLVVRDLLGAGDCFAGGALAGLMLSSQDPLVALRCGSLAAALALADIGHTALLRFLADAGLAH